ncbi:MAG TPA: LamG domain-containing protein [Solirubrobacteraceae bacterium]|nr:LamG domain-containing protein [Solirubrobacteraceae bacterium]
MRRAALVVASLAALALGAAPGAAHAAGYAAAIASPDLAAHWRLGDPLGTTAASAVPAVPAGTASGVAFGADGALSGAADTAARFAGAGTISVGGRPTFAGPFSVEAWVRLDSRRTNALAADGSAAGGSGTSNGWYLGTNSDATLRFDVGMSGGLVSVQTPAISSAAWHHVVATVSGAEVIVYVDGVRQASQPARGTPLPATGSSLRLGRATSGSSRYLRGALDEVALYRAALHPATVTGHFAAGADTTPPRTAFATGPAALSPAASASFAFASPKPMVTYECRLDAGAWAPCASPARLAGMTDGPHTFAVRARDRYGIVESAPRAWSWTVDTAAPGTLALAILPSAVTPSASVSFSSEPGARFQCRGASGAWAPCASPVSAPAGSDLAVRAVDAAGNADPTPATLAVPAAPPAASPVSALTGPSAAFGFWTDGTTNRPECSLDGATWAPCGATLTTGPLAPGPHGLSVRAAGPGGGVQTAHASWTVTLPAPRLVGVQFPVLVYVPPAAKIRKPFPSSRLPAVRFSLNVGASVRLRLERTSGARKGRHIPTWTVGGRAGANVSRLPLAVYRRLGAARYRLTADAAGAAGRSVSRALRFQVVRKRAGR